MNTENIVYIHSGDVLTKEQTDTIYKLAENPEATMDKEIINELIGVDLKVRTNQNNEKMLRFTDLKNCKDVTISYDCESCNFVEHYGHDVSLPPVLKEIKITIPCNRFLLEVLDV